MEGVGCLLEWIATMSYMIFDKDDSNQETVFETNFCVVKWCESLRWETQDGGL